MKFQDLTGQQIGNWKVLNIAFRKNGKIYYHCQCQCENKTEKDVQAQHLKEKRSLSCGCLRKQLISERTKKDITGQRFGKLIVLEEADKEEYNDTKIHWKCQCDCGNIKIISGSSLRQGLTKSCGCVKSYGEEKIIKLLTENNIPFVSEKDFDDFRYPDTNFKAKFDFYVNNQYIVEYDGKQHFGIGGWNDNENFIKTTTHDTLKNQWCKENGIPLIRIPYTHFNELCIEDLLLETSKFIVGDKND